MHGHPRRRAAAPSPLDLLAAAERVAHTRDIVIAPPPDPRACDAAGRRITPQQTSGFRRGKAPLNKGKTYEPDPPSVAECMAMLDACGPDAFGRRRFAAIVLLWQGALRAFEALALTEDDVDDKTGRLIVRHGKGDKRATITMAQWAWPFLDDWRALRVDLPDPRGPLLCIIDGPTVGHAWPQSSLRGELHRVARAADVKRRISCHQFRHAWAAQAYASGVPLRTIQLHLRHENIGVTDTYLRGLGLDESREHVYQLAVPTVPATALLERLPGSRAT